VTEQQVYSVLDRRNGYELRRYAAHVVAEVTMIGTFERAGNAAFGPLVSYISGRNTTGTKVAMTAPVFQESTADPQVHRVWFVMPHGSTAQDLPAPASDGVQLHDVPASVCAASTYAGRWTQASYERHVRDLLDVLARDGVAVLGPPRYARFDPPWKPWILRRNEVVIPVRF
jgi:hypothetical protein